MMYCTDGDLLYLVGEALDKEKGMGRTTLFYAVLNCQADCGMPNNEYITSTLIR